MTIKILQSKVFHSFFFKSLALKVFGFLSSENPLMFTIHSLKSDRRYHSIVLKSRCPADTLPDFKCSKSS